MKKCSKCGVDKELGEFYENKGNCSECKICHRIYMKTHYRAYKEKYLSKQKIYYETNRDEIKARHRVYNETYREEIKIYRDTHKAEKKAYMKIYLGAHKEERKAYKKAYSESHKDKIKVYQKAYRESHNDERKNYYNTYHIKRLKTDIQYKLACRLRTRLYMALKGGQKSGSAVRDLGCTIPDLVVCLEKQFKPKMNWNNYGEWHIDHIVPLNSFDLTDRKQFLKACHYTNLQPLWAIDNIIKGNKITY